MNLFNINSKRAGKVKEQLYTACEKVHGSTTPENCYTLADPCIFCLAAAVIEDQLCHIDELEWEIEGLENELNAKSSSNIK